MEPTRREVLLGSLPAGAGIIAACAAGLKPARAEEKRPSSSREEPFVISLNTSTIRERKLPLAEVVDIAARAGYGGIEPWPDEIDRHLESGGTLEDLAKRMRDAGIAVTGAISFFEWMVDDDARRARGLEDARRRMDQIAKLGGKHLAAPPSGNVEKVDLLRAAERYRALLDLSEAHGVAPAVEVWGFARNGHRLGQCVLIALESGHPKACVLPDVYHLHRGGSGLGGIRFLAPRLIAGFHMNDYPGGPAEKLNDSDRVYPGDGVAPLEQLIRDLRDIGYRGAISIELFNREYYKQDPALVARTAIEKMRAVIAKALA